jgi:hypothetical protein
MRFKMTSVRTEISALRWPGKTAMQVALDGKLAGFVALADRIRATTVEAIPHPATLYGRPQFETSEFMVRGRGYQTWIAGWPTN